MNPVAFEVFGIAIRWYGIFISSGMIIAIFLTLRWAKPLGYTDNDIIDLALVVLPSAIIGARLYYVLFNLEYYQGDIMEMINIRGGGMAIHGGVFAGILSGYIFTKIRKLNSWQLADIIAPVLVLAQAIGRWGNFANGEAHGGPTDLPWGIVVDGVKVHPTFLYESVWNLGVFALLVLFRKHKKFEGEIMCWYGVLYSLGRFWIEGLRTDSLMFFGLRTAQLVSLGLILICGGLIVYNRKKAKDIKTNY
jgi:prolipoprotein diacylglyceryl transferase